MDLIHNIVLEIKTNPNKRRIKIKTLNLKNVVAVGRYNEIRSFCSGSQNLKPVKLTNFGQTGIYNSDLFSKTYDVNVLNFAGVGQYGRIWFKGWCAVKEDPCG